jgi:hypothetical protein
MWWQEWFGDWAAYIVYNPHFTLIPWHATTWTTPNKPWAVIPAYGWYYTLSLLLLVALVDRVRRSRPHASALLTAVAVGLPLFYLIDLLVEGGASVLGMWSYDHYVGPAITSSKGNFPLLHPIVFFAVWCTVMGVLVVRPGPDVQDDRTVLDRLLRVGRPGPVASATAAPAPHARATRGGTAVLERTAPAPAVDGLTVRANLLRLGAWVLTFNVSYWVLFVFPIVLIRQLGGVHSDVVP